MRSSAFITTAASAIKRRQTFLALSQPGLGKSSCLVAAAILAGIDPDDVLVSHCPTDDQSVATGLPNFNDDGTASFVPIGILAKALRATRPTLLLLDDITHASSEVQAAYLSLCLNREASGQRLPDCVSICATGNFKGRGMGTKGLLHPLRTRFTTAITLEAHAEDWAEWATGQHIDPVVVAFIRWSPEALICDADDLPKGFESHPSPRTWAGLSECLNWGLPRGGAEEREVLCGAVGEASATAWLAFRHAHGMLPHADAILRGDFGQAADATPGVLYSVASTLAYRATPATMEHLCNFALHLADKGRGEYASLLMGDISRRHPDLQETTAYAAAMCGPLGDILGGALLKNTP